MIGSISLCLKVCGMRNILTNFILVSNIMGDLRCFHTKASFDEDVLGIPLEFTINPRTDALDYIYSSMDILSASPFYKERVRKSVCKEKFTHCLPLYITKYTCSTVLVNSNPY